MLLYAGGKLADYTSYSRSSSLSEQGAEILPWIILAIVVIVIVFLIYKNTDQINMKNHQMGWLYL